jgi:PAS domain S-box-containing protein
VERVEDLLSVDVLPDRDSEKRSELPWGTSRIFGSGEMADRTRGFDWSRTPVGPVDLWPETLLITVNMLLASRHPMFLWWGEDLTQFYNDAYRPNIRDDKHPQALGQPGRQCWPEIWPVIGPQIEAVLQRGSATWSENQLVPIHRNGRLEDVYWTYGYSPVRDPSGTIRGVLVVCTDTTAAVLAAEEVRRERRRLSDLFQQAPAFFALLGGPEFVFEMVNAQYEELLGARALLGKTVREAIPEAEAQGFVQLLEGVYRSGVPFVGHSTPIVLKRMSGESELRYLDFVYQARRESDGTISGVIALGVDVTERKRAQELLLQSEKLAAVGRLASSIAHEINNPLEAVTNLLFLARGAAINPDAIKYLVMAETELQRVSAIANQTLRFHRQTTSPRPVNLAELIGDTLALYQGKLVNAHVAVERRDLTDRAIECFDGEVRQVLSNLIGNAIDAMSVTGGRLLLRTRNATEVTTGRSGMTITVADTGSGIAEETVPHIFEPFFTTKGFSGTGLGLWVSREIVVRHQGSLRVRSRQTPGCSWTVFSLFLPSTREDAG